MSISKRIAEAKASVSTLLALDHKALPVEEQKKLSNDLLDARVRISEAFTGEQRTEEVVKLIESLTAKRKLVESGETIPAGEGSTSTDGAPTIPGTFSALDKALQAVGTAREKTTEQVKKTAELIAANLGKVDQIIAAVEAVIAGTKPQIDEAKFNELKTLLSEARDEIISLTERAEAATVIISTFTERVKSLKVERDAALLKESKAVAALAELNGNAEQTKKVAETKEAEPKKVDESTKKEPEAVVEAAKPKTLTERLRAVGTTRQDESALPAQGSKVASTPDAVKTEPKQSINEGVEPVAKDPGAAVFRSSMRHIKAHNGKAL